MTDVNGVYRRYMTERSYEHEMEPRSAVRRYYNDIRLSRTALDGLLAVENLYESLPCEPTEPLEEILAGQNMPFEFEYDIDLRSAREKLALLPLRYFDEDIMRSDCSLDEAKEWYSEVVRYTVRLTEDSHAVECLEYDAGTTAHYMCKVSTDCPWRFLEAVLADPASEYDFTEQIYKSRPGRMRSLITHKLDLGKAFNILEKNYAETKKVQYDEALWRYLTDGPQKAEWGIE